MAEITYREAIREALDEEMARDPNVIVLSESPGEDCGEEPGDDVGAVRAVGANDGLLARYGASRVIGAPVSGAATVGVAIGAGQMGLRPVVEMHSGSAAANAFGMLAHHVATARRQALPCAMVVRVLAGGRGLRPPFDGGPDTGFGQLPGLKVVAPATAADAKGLMKSAIRDDACVLFLEHADLCHRLSAVMPAGDHLVPIGKAHVARDGGDLTIITYGAALRTALDAAAELAVAGVAAEVLDLRTLAPLDDDAIFASVRKTHRALVVHDQPRTGGLAGEITARLSESCFEWLDAPVLRVTAADLRLPFDPALVDGRLPQVADIVMAVKRLVAY